jgi:hypothetical protein
MGESQKGVLPAALTLVVRGPKLSFLTVMAYRVSEKFRVGIRPPSILLISDFSFLSKPYDFSDLSNFVGRTLEFEAVDSLFLLSFGFLSNKRSSFH